MRLDDIFTLLASLNDKLCAEQLELEELVSTHGAPRFLRSDHGPEFVSHAILRWLTDAAIDTALNDPGKP
jgi:hypothetical protein